ncbi:ETS domain-containing protein [Endozoicomonas elysicola]|uniref:ETS domain-containing protein n=1 Tax=Endozoicomonas elysicola TaxID=305900 RepID=A0A081KD07_9GAMM|nr:ETS domain-containing protein [Endozoicomonas elysicola]KEI72033.1 hypothetical protein GV64_16050 [Endozoicomonas elysicola]
MEPAAARPNASGHASGQYNVNNPGNPSRIGPFHLLMENGTPVLQGVTLGQRNMSLRPDPVPILPKQVADSRIPVSSNTNFTPTRRQQHEYSPQVPDSYSQHTPECSAIYTAKPSEVKHPVHWILDPSKDTEKECPLSIAIRQSANPSSNQEEYATYQQLHNLFIPELMKMAGKRDDESWINYQDEYGFTPLMNAAMHGALRCIEPLINAGANPLWERGSTALHEALSEEKHSWGGTRYDVLQTMLSALKKKVPGQLVGLMNKKLSPDEASTFKNLLPEMKKKLKSENTVLHQLMRRGNGIGAEEVIKLTKLLLEFGADPMVENGEGKTVFEYAWSERDNKGRQDIVQALLNNMPFNRLCNILAQPCAIPFELQIKIQTLINQRVHANVGRVNQQAPALVPCVPQGLQISRGQQGLSQSPLTHLPVRTTAPCLPLSVVKQNDQEFSAEPKVELPIPETFISMDSFQRPVAPEESKYAVDINPTRTLIQQPADAGVGGSSGASEAYSLLMSAQQTALLNGAMSANHIQSCFPVGEMTGSHTGSNVHGADTALAAHHPISATVSFDDYNSSKYVEMMDDVGGPAVAQELLTLLGDFLDQNPTALDQPTASCLSNNIDAWNDHSAQSTVADSMIKTESSVPLLTHEAMDKGTFDNPFVNVEPWEVTDQPLTDFESMPSCSTHWAETKAPTTPVADAISSGSTTSFSAKDSDSDSLYSDGDTHSEVSMSVNSSFPEMVNAYQGQLTERQAMIKARRLSELVDDMSDPTRSAVDVHLPQYAPPVSPVSSANDSDRDDIPFFPAIFPTVVQPRKRGRPRTVELAGNIERKCRKTSEKQGKGILDFLVEELDKEKSVRIKGLKWHSKQDGIYIREQKANAELARRWGDYKNNPGMTYDKFARALRGYYGNTRNQGQIEHLTCGLDGTSEENLRSKYYRIHLKK